MYSVEIFVGIIICRGRDYGVLRKCYVKKTCLTAAQDRKGLTLSSMYHEVVLSAILPVHINASSAECVMLQCFPVLMISKLKPIVVLKHRCNPILVLCMKRILFFTDGLIET
jgi:hypothetical protein